MNNSVLCKDIYRGNSTLDTSVHNVSLCTVTYCVFIKKQLMKNNGQTTHHRVDSICINVHKMEKNPP